MTTYRSGFEDAYARCYPAVVRSAWSIIGDLSRAEELAQEAFVRAYPRWGRLERGGYAEAWLHRVAMNLALTAATRRRRGRHLEASSEVWTSIDLAPDDGWLVDTLRHLPRRQREAVFLRVVADLPEEEVGAVMGCAPGSVKVHKKRGLERLRTLMNREEGDTHVPDGNALTADRTAARAANG